MDLKRSMSSQSAYDEHFDLSLQVFVMTPQILLNSLRHTFVKLEQIKLLIFDECHHARGKHPYACIMVVRPLLTCSAFCPFVSNFLA